MNPKTPPPTPVSDPICPTSRQSIVTKVSEPIPYDNLNGPWKLVSVPANEIESDISQWSEEISKPEVCITGKYSDDAYEVAIDPLHLLELKSRHCHMKLDYNPTKPRGRQNAIYGIHTATRKARDQWLQRAVGVIRSGHQPEVDEAYRDHARSNGLHEELARATSIPLVQQKLAQNCVLLFLNLEKDHTSSAAYNYLGSDQDELLESLQCSLRIPVPPKRTKCDETQITLLVRALLELSGGRVEVQQHRFMEEYTASENADLCASVFNVTRSRQFGDVDPKEICKMLSKSVAFSEMTISIQYVEEWTAKMMDSLRVGFRKGYLELPSQMLSAFGFGQIDIFKVYLMHTYQTIPPLQKPGNNTLLLLTWSTVVSDRQLNVLREWASSENSLYKQLIRDFRDPHSAEQLTLIMAALMSYRRLLPDLSDNSERPIRGSYLADLDALLDGYSLGNSGIVVERMVFSLVRVFRSSGNQFEELTTILETSLDREPPLLHVFDGFCDQYWTRRIDSHSHQTAMIELSHVKMPKLREDGDPDWVTVALPEALPAQDHSQRPYNDHTLPAVKMNSMEQSHSDHPLKIGINGTSEVPTAPRIAEDMAPCIGAESSLRVLLPPLGFHGDQYTLIRMFGVEDENVLKILDANIGKVNEVPHIEELSDGSWEICILKSHRHTIKDKLRQIFPGSNVELYYNPLGPTAKDLKIWGCGKAKMLYEEWFFERAIRVIKEGWPAGAACYAHRLKVMSGLRIDFTLVPTYQGYLQSKEDAVHLLEACLSGKLVHSRRGPQDGEATISGNIFVWEANITGIDDWRDGMEWNLWQEDGFEVGRAIDGSGLMKKTVDISRRGRSHQVVSYYTACDAPTLARPSKELDLGPFSNLTPYLDAQLQRHFHNEMVLPHRRHNHQQQGSSKNTLYACTFSECFKKFGSKSAWKLHENSQHVQQECWLRPFCPYSFSNQTPMYENEDGDGHVPTRSSYDRCAYTTHLQSVHSVDNDTVDQQTEEQKIGRNCPSRFWCGFCGEIVPFQKKRLEGGNERFDHVEEHSCGGGQITNYIEMDGGGLKGKDGEGELDGCHTSIASSVDDAEVLSFQDGGARCNDGIHEIGMTREESSAGADEGDDDFDSTPLLQRPCD